MPSVAWSIPPFPTTQTSPRRGWRCPAAAGLAPDQWPDHRLPPATRWITLRPIASEPANSTSVPLAEAAYSVELGMPRSTVAAAVPLLCTTQAMVTVAFWGIGNRRAASPDLAAAGHRDASRLDVTGTPMLARRCRSSAETHCYCPPCTPCRDPRGHRVEGKKSSGRSGSKVGAVPAQDDRAAGGGVVADHPDPLALAAYTPR